MLSLMLGLLILGELGLIGRMSAVLGDDLSLRGYEHSIL